MALPKVGVEAVIEGMGAFSADAKKVNQAFGDMDASASKLGKASTGLTSHLTSLGGSLLKVGAIAGGAALAGVAALGAGLAGFAVGGIKAAIDLDQQVANIAATMGATSETAGNLKEELKGLALDLSLNPDLTVDVTQAGQAIEVLAANGALATDEFGKLTQASKDLAVQTVALANATGSDFATAANIATGASTLFGLQVDEMGKAIDGAAGIMNTSKFNANDYKDALAQAGGVAAGAGVSLEDFNTVLAATSTQFASGSDAGTALKTFLQQLSAPTDKAKAAMEKYGISLFNADGSMRNMKDIAEDLNRVFTGTVTITSQVGGATKEQAKAAETASKNMGDLTRDIQENKDKLKLMTDVYQESLKFYDAGEPRMRKQALAIQGLTNNITDQEEKLADYNSALAAIDDAQVKTITSTEKLSDAEKAWLADTIAGSDGVRILNGLTQLTGEEFNALSESVNRSGQGLEAAALRVDTVKGAMDIFKGVLQAIQIQVGDAFLPLLKEMAIQFTGLATQAGPQIVEFFKKVADNIGLLIVQGQELFAAFQQGGFTGLATALGIPESVITGIQNASTAIQELFNTFSTQGAGTGLSSLFDKLDIGGMLQRVADKAVAQIPPTLTKIITAISNFLNNNWPTIQATLFTWSDKFFEWVDRLLPKAGEFLSKVMTAIATWISDSATQAKLTQIGQDIGVSIFNGLSKMLSDSSKITEILLKVAGALAIGVAGITAALIAVGGQIVAGILSGILESMGIDLQPAALNELGTILKNIGSDIATIAKELGRRVVESIKAGWNNAWASVRDWGVKFEAILKAGQEMLNPEKWAEIGKGIIEGVVEGIHNHADQVLEVLKAMARDALLGVMNVLHIQSPSGVFAEIGRQIIAGLVSGIDATGQTVQQAVARQLNFTSQMFRDFEALEANERQAAENSIKATFDAFYGRVLAGTAGVGDLMADFSQRVLSTGIFDPSEVKQAIRAIDFSAIVETVRKQVGPLTLEMKAQAVSLASSFSSIATGFADMLKDQMTSVTKMVAKMSRLELEQAAFGFFGGSDKGIKGQMAAIKILQDFLASGVDKLLIPSDELSKAAGYTGTLLDRVFAQNELNRLLAEQKKQEEEILKAQKAQQQLQFLQQQISLMQLIAQQGLNPAQILQGITLGLNASVTDLLSATSNVVQAMVQRINDDLEMHSPSKVMAGIGQNIMAGLSQGVAAMTPVLQNQLNASIAAPLSPAMAGAIAGATSSTTNNFYTGGNNINNGMDSATFEARVIQVIRRELGA